MSPIQSYLTTPADADHHTELVAMYDLLKSLLSDATEKLSYGMPAFYVAGKPVIYFAAAKHHLGLYPTASPIAHFTEELASYHTSKGAIQLPYDQPLPKELIADIVAFRVHEITD
ncbi:iron chaperone [Levilactobacillus fujinensis]|uniref:Iron chaperone n=1 Tax=Levilactobacillus fujinensis TaxID=2486024 RepID=A0ABW1TIF7_9LACO|nr:DUF1801 domain-containing protein [Levilactobacillus fujinensis]